MVTPDSVALGSHPRGSIQLHRCSALPQQPTCTLWTMHTATKRGVLLQVDRPRLWTFFLRRSGHRWEMVRICMHAACDRISDTVYLFVIYIYIYIHIYKYRSLHAVVISHVLEVIHKFRLSALEGFAIPWYIQKAVHLILNVLLLQVNDIERPRSMEAFLPKRPCPSKGVFMNKHVMVCSVMRCKWTMKPSIYATYAILGFLDYMAVAWN